MNIGILEQFTAAMTKDLGAAMYDQRAEIMAAIQKIIAASHESGEDKPIVFSVSFSGKLDLDKSAVETAFAFNVKTTVKGSHTLRKDGEPEFTFGEDERPTFEG